MTTRGERNNNPGNVRRSANAWVGKVKGTDPAFETFDTVENGIRALSKILLHYQRVDKITSIKGLISKWAPALENDTSAYIDHVSSECEVSPLDPIDLSVPANLVKVAKAIILHENGRCIYNDEIILAGVTEALK